MEKEMFATFNWCTSLCWNWGGLEQSHQKVIMFSTIIIFAAMLFSFSLSNVIGKNNFLRMSQRGIRKLGQSVFKFFNAFFSAPNPTTKDDNTRSSDQVYTI